MTETSIKGFFMTRNTILWIDVLQLDDIISNAGDHVDL